MSSYVWHLPTSGGSGTGLASATTRRQAAKLFGRDIWFDVSAEIANYIVTPAGDWLTVEGAEALRQSLLRRIITNPGEWAARPNFGVGARQFVRARNTRATRDELAERVRAQFLSDPRVESVQEITVKQFADGGLFLSAPVRPLGRLRPDDVLGVRLEVR